MILEIDDNLVIYRKDGYYKPEFSPYFLYKDDQGPIKKIWKEFKPKQLQKREAPDTKAIKSLILDVPEPYEYDIPLKKRYQIDTRTAPHYIKDELTYLAFDIEVYNEGGAVDARKDPIIAISYATKDKADVLMLSNGNRQTPYKSEKQLIKAFMDIVLTYDPDILVGYNSFMFDLPYLQKRAKKHGIVFNIARWGLDMGKKKVKIPGRIHVDMYKIVRLFKRLGVIEVKDYTLKTVYETLFGEDKFSITKNEIWKMWQDGDKDLWEYSLSDALATKALFEHFFDLIIELSHTSRTFMQELVSSTPGQLVENLLLYEGGPEFLIPALPSREEVEYRESNPIKGAYVKLPEPGIYENIAVLDFRSLYPSIIITYNIDYYTYNKEGKGYISPLGHAFLDHPQGLIPRILEGLIDERDAIKKKLKEDPDNKQLQARAQALKVLANSFYGYMGYPRSRYYLREAAESVTAWGRKHIMEVIEEAEKWGFKVLYTDTDSVFLIYEKKEDILRFLEYINKKLPGKMRLDLENFYIRGLFVTKKGEEAGAKKKYALLAEDGSVKIRGFELVRRDWSPIARETQRKVLDIILKEGSKEKAISYIQEVVKRLRRGEVKPEELVITSQITKSLDKYDVISPEVMAAKRLRQKGEKVKPGTLIRYIIAAQDGKTSDKAWPYELFKSHNLQYDAEYYIHHQVLPAVMKLIQELGVSEAELTENIKQSSLDSF
ncbi:MAG: DNA polymerase [Candidatus Micrarchaeota archaeon]|nr:DNA polymerase [Candidatus Micrarchaeota archaeon]